MPSDKSKAVESIADIAKAMERRRQEDAAFLCAACNELNAPPSKRQAQQWQLCGHLTEVGERDDNGSTEYATFVCPTCKASWMRIRDHEDHAIHWSVTPVRDAGPA